MAELFDFVKNILNGKDQLPIDGYNPYMVNYALSQNFDTVLYANEMNKNHFLESQMQYDYLFKSIRKHSRPFKSWIGKTKNNDVTLIQQCYGVSVAKAKQMLEILNKEQIKSIRDFLDEGGR